MNINESGNCFDYNFFNKYYFDALFEKEARLFLGIKEFKSFNDYEQNLENVISEEKGEKLSSDSINKFKKLESVSRRCIKSKIFDSYYVTQEEYDNL